VGFEPTTRGLKGHCSNLLSYGPAISGQENNFLYYLYFLKIIKVSNFIATTNADYRAHCNTGY
jgi:hypothetical protein